MTQIVKDFIKFLYDVNESIREAHCIVVVNHCNKKSNEFDNNFIHKTHYMSLEKRQTETSISNQN